MEVAGCCLAPFTHTNVSESQRKAWSWETFVSFCGCASLNVIQTHLMLLRTSLATELWSEWSTPVLLLDWFLLLSNCIHAVFIFVFSWWCFMMWYFPCMIHLPFTSPVTIYKADAWKIRWKVYCNKITEALTIINIIILLEDTMTTHFYVIACVIRVNLA